MVVETSHSGIIMDYSHIQLARSDMAKYRKTLKANPIAGERHPHSAIFVSFYTPDFKAPAMRLKKSLDKLGLEHDIVPIGDKGRWRFNEAAKPEFIYEMVKKYKGKKDAVVWVDADGEMVNYPELCFSSPEELAFHWHTWHHPISCLVLVKTTNKMVKTCEEWAKLSYTGDNSDGCPSQVALLNVIATNNLSWLQLPGNYVMRFLEATRHKTEKKAIYMHTRWGR